VVVLVVVALVAEKENVTAVKLVKPALSDYHLQS